MRDVRLIVSKLFCLGLSVVVFSSWDVAYPPIITNEYQHAVYVEAIYSDGSRFKSIRKPGISSFTRKKGITCVSIKVYSEDEVLLAEYSEDVLNELKAKAVDDLESWALTERGIFLIPRGYGGVDETKKYLEMLYATMKYNCDSKDATAN